MTPHLRLAYGTNGFSSHRLADALDVIAGLGYEGVAVTLDVGHLDPFGAELAREVDALGRRLDRLGLAIVIETGGRYVLDPRRKHEPSLMSDQRDRRVDLLRRAVSVARDLGAPVVSMWSGAAPAGLGSELAWRRLTEACATVIQAAAECGLTLGLEPEPGMLVDTTAAWTRLATLLGHPGALRLTLDVGHIRCNEPEPIPATIRAMAGPLVHVQIDDMRRGHHEHLEFGAGEVDLPATLAALVGIGFDGLVAVELPRFGHDAPAVAERSLAALRRALDAASGDRAAAVGPPVGAGS